MHRLAQLDLLKGLAIISVIILHSLTESTLVKIGAPFYIWQAVPIFIIVASFNSSNSYKRNWQGLTDAYKNGILARRFNRLLIPFVFVWTAEIVVAMLMHIMSWASFINFGFGPGGYFVPIMVQHILILPVMYLFARRNLKGLLIVTFIIDLVLEVVLFKLGLPASIYRILYVRYLFAGSLGIWLSMTKKKMNVWVVVGAALSLLYITVVNYFGFQLPIEPSWRSQNVPSFIYPLLLIIIAINYFPQKVKTGLGVALDLIGKGSYHIFLFQMVYFWVRSGVPVIRSLSPGISIMVNLIICIPLGLIFERMEGKVRLFLKLQKTVKPGMGHGKSN
jgi:peptidoglycan/LPS O-acetylase OafA/YrhL